MVIPMGTILLIYVFQKKVKIENIQGMRVFLSLSGTISIHGLFWRLVEKTNYSQGRVMHVAWSEMGKPTWMCIRFLFFLLFFFIARKDIIL